MLTAKEELGRSGGRQKQKEEVVVVAVGAVVVVVAAKAVRVVALGVSGDAGIGGGE